MVTTYINPTMTFNMKLSEQNISLKEVIGIAMVLIPLIGYQMSLDHKVTQSYDLQLDSRKTQVEFVKDYYIDREAMRNQLNQQGQEIKMQGLRIEMLEKKINGK